MQEIKQEKSKQIRKNSRTKKALTSSLLIYYALKENMKIKFQRTRVPDEVLKVLRGISVEIKNTKNNSNDFYFQNENEKYEKEDFCEISKSFLQTMKLIIEEYKLKNKNDLFLDYDLYQKYNLKIENSNSSENSSKMSVKKDLNNETYFSNFLSFMLLKKNYILHLSMKNVKQSNKLNQFFLFDSIRKKNENFHIYDSIQEKWFYESIEKNLQMKNGNEKKTERNFCFKIKENEQKLIDLIQLINKKLLHCQEIIITSDILIEIWRIEKPLSCFIKSNCNYVVNSHFECNIHPFHPNN